ncbi:hypothetical protein BAE44_0010435, partial [Dichanthelium oligosanthes]
LRRRPRPLPPRRGRDQRLRPTLAATRRGGVRRACPVGRVARGPPPPLAAAIARARRSVLLPRRCGGDGEPLWQPRGSRRAASTSGRAPAALAGAAGRAAGAVAGPRERWEAAQGGRREGGVGRSTGGRRRVGGAGSDQRESARGRRRGW